MTITDTEKLGKATIVSSGGTLSYLQPGSEAGMPFTVQCTWQRSNVGSETSQNEDETLSLARTASAISGYRSEYIRQEKEQAENKMIGEESGLRDLCSLPTIEWPEPTKAGPLNTIRDAPADTTPTSQTETQLLDICCPQSTRQLSSNPENGVDLEGPSSKKYPKLATIRSWRGALVLTITCGAQMLDNVFMTGVNISLPAIQNDFNVDHSNLQWLISAYTLTFGGFLLLSGVLSDRYGRKNIFCIGMAWLSIWTMADGFAASFIQLAIFRALQGIGAAMTVPSGVGLIGASFISEDRTKALSIFASAGAIGFCVGFLLGGFLTSSLNWRYLFYVTVTLAGVLGLIGWISLPRDRLEDHVTPRLDFLGSGLSTAGLILLSFVIASGGEYGWGKAFIIILLILSIALIAIFTYAEKKAANPIMPLSIWKRENFALLWIAGFVGYGGYQTLLYYAILISQEILHLSPSTLAICFIPVAVVGGSFTILMGNFMTRFNTKHLLLVGLGCCTLAPIPTAVMSRTDLDFWKHIFPTCVISVMGIAITYCTITVVALASVPLSAKSLCGGMINTSFQIGSGVGLAVASAIVQATEINKGHGLLSQYETGMWCCVGFAGIGFLGCLFVKTTTAGHIAGSDHCRS